MTAEPTVYLLLHTTPGAPRMVADALGRLVVTLRGDLATLMTMAVAAERDYTDVTLLKRTPSQLADVMLANDVPPGEMAERLLFIEQVGPDLATDAQRVAAVTALVPGCPEATA